MGVIGQLHHRIWNAPRSARCPKKTATKLPCCLTFPSAPSSLASVDLERRRRQIAVHLHVSVVGGEVVTARLEKLLLRREPRILAYPNLNLGKLARHLRL